MLYNTCYLAGQFSLGNTVGS